MIFGIQDTVHQWFRSYLLGQKQYVWRGLVKSSKVRMTCSVSQGVSVGSTAIYFITLVNLLLLIEDNGFSPNLYADDTQVYGSCPPVEVESFSAKLSECVGVVSNWMRSNRLHLISDKTEVLWCATGRRQHQLPTTALFIDGIPVSPVTSVRNLGIFIDANLVMRDTRSTYGNRDPSLPLRQLRQIRNSVPTATFNRWWSHW